MAATRALTKQIVEKAPPGFTWDSRVPGFGVRVLASGRRSYVHQYRAKSGKQRRTVLGVHGAITVEQARDMARDLYEAVRRGGDPVEERRQAANRSRDTVEAVIDEFMRRHMEGRKRSGTYIRDTRARFDKYVLPRWRGRDIRAITRRDVIDLLDAIVDEGKPLTANRTLTAVRKLFNWALQRGIVDASPVASVQHPAEETKRERTLTPDELMGVWAAAGELGYPFGSFFRIALLTGQRRDEVASMRWQDVDETEGIWTLPSDQTKPGRAHIVPLSPLALEIMAGLRERRGDGPYIFSTTGGERPISGYSKAKTRLDAAITRLREEDGLPALAPWRIHDLRRTVGTGLGRLGVSRFVIARVLNHADRTVTGIYDRHEYLAEKRRALNAWAAEIGRIIGEPPAENVVPLRA
jgi:integrase